MNHARRVGAYILIALMAAALLVPTAALATVIPFASAPPVAGGGSGAGVVWPWGFGFITNTNGAAWGDDAGDTYGLLTRDTTYTPSGAQGFVAFVDKNPATNKPYIVLKKNGVAVPGLDTHIGVPLRPLPVPYATYLSENGTLFAGETTDWSIPITNVTLDPGCAYELSFLRGIKANNLVSCVIYTDALGADLGYIQNNTTPSYPDEAAQYIAKQYDTFRFRNPYTGTHEDFLFRFQTYADLTAFNGSFQEATIALAAASSNEGTAPGQVDPALVAALDSVVTSSGAVAPGDMAKWLQPSVDAATAELDAAVAAIVTNPFAFPVTAVSGIPSGWATGPVTFSLSVVSGDAPPFTSYYALNGGSFSDYSTPVTVSAEGTTALEFNSADSHAQTETVQSTNIRIDSIAPSTGITGVTAGRVYPTGAVVGGITLIPSDAVSGVADTYYSIDGSIAGLYTGPLSVSGSGNHTIEYWSADEAGNIEAHKTLSFSITAERTSITINTDATWFRQGSTAILSGVVTPSSTVGRIVVVYVQKPGSARWSYSSNRGIYASGGRACWQYKYHFTSRMKRGTYRFKASLPYSPEFRAANSAVLSVTFKY